MKRATSLCVILLFMHSFAFAQDFDFRKTRWGMSVEDVISSEGKDPAERVDGRIIYEDEDVAGIKFKVVYFFEDNKLFTAKYFNTYQTVYNTSADFFELRQIMDKKYGKSKLHIDKPSYVNSLESHLSNMAVSGRGGFSATWKTKDTTVMLELEAKSTNFFILTAFYNSVKYKYLFDKNKTRELTNKGAKL